MKAIHAKELELNKDGLLPKPSLDTKKRKGVLEKILFYYDRAKTNLRLINPATNDENVRKFIFFYSCCCC
jgi:hypothetical protein